MAGWLDSKTFQVMEGALDGLSLRHKVLVDNIANNDTPNFKRSDVNFDSVLQAALDSKDPGKIELRRTHASHFPGIGLTGNFVIQDTSTSMRNDGNNVDIDKEMTLLAENTLHYSALSNAYTSHLSKLKQVIQS